MTEATPSIAEIVCILDRSGSMTGREHDTIEGFNGFVKNQRELGPGRLTLVLFSGRRDYEVIHDDIALSTVPKLTRDVYQTRGSTALMDAVGKTIAMVKERHLEDRPEQTIFMIITDGEENNSIEYTREGQIREMVNECQEDLEWQFFFLGVGIDAFAEARMMGIHGVHTAMAADDAQGYNASWQAAEAAASMSRTSGGGLSGTTMQNLYDDEEEKQSSGSGAMA